MILAVGGVCRPPPRTLAPKMNKNDEFSSKVWKNNEANSTVVSGFRKWLRSECLNSGSGVRIPEVATEFRVASEFQKWLPNSGSGARIPEMASEFRK